MQGMEVQIDTTEIGWAISHFTVGFVGLSSVEGWEQAMPAGSGVLVSVGQVYGILTAAHVLANLPTHGEVGLVDFPRVKNRVQKPKVDMAHTDRVSIQGSEWGPNGPDIAFLKLPQNVVGNLKMSKSFKNLDVAREKALNPKAPTNQSFDSILGVIGENTTDIIPNIPNTRIRGFEARFQIGQITPIVAVDGTSRSLFVPTNQGDVPMPNTFAGTSGGGIWRTYWNLDSDQKFNVVETRLCGIAYFQSEKVGSNRVLTCHGPKSIYLDMVKLIQDKWPEARAN